MGKDKQESSAMTKIMLPVTVVRIVLLTRDGSALEGLQLQKIFAIKSVETEGETLEK
jgi:hypothetical protein